MDCFIQVSVVIHDYRVLAAHLGDDALHVPLARPHFHRRFENPETYGVAAREGDQARPGMLDHGIAERAAGARCTERTRTRPER